MHNISNLFYFGTALYMFRTVSPSIIRILRLYIKHHVYVIQILWLLASRSRSADHQQTRTLNTHMIYTWGHIQRNNTNSTERKSAGGIVTAQSRAEDPLKMVVKKDRNI